MYLERPVSSMRIAANFSAADTSWDDALAVTTRHFSTSPAPLGLATGLLLAAALGDTKHTAQYWQLVGALCGLLVALVLLAILYCYRQLVRCLLFLQHGHHFAGLMTGSDAVWTVEDPTSQPVINILAIIAAGSGEDLMTSLRTSMARTIHSYPRLSYTRHTSQLGYSYWRRGQPALEGQIRWLSGYENFEDLLQCVSRMANTPLPKDVFNWEVLVGDSPVFGEQFPVLFRVHHSVGDGVTLVGLLLDTFSSQGLRIQSLVKRQRTTNQSNVHISSWEDTIKLLLRHGDSNPLRSRHLSGQKVVALSHEINIAVVKHIKNKMAGARFTDVLLAALSASLEHHFRSLGRPVPQDLCVVIPARIAVDQHNGFSPGLLTLPLIAASPRDRLAAVCRSSAALRSSGQHVFNWRVISLAGSVLPVPLLGRLLSSLPSTMVVSNVVGPAEEVEVQGHLVRGLAFWVPNRGDTGVGVSIFSYAGRLQLGLLADRAVVSSSSEASSILERVVLELDILDRALAANTSHSASQDHQIK